MKKKSSKSLFEKFANQALTKKQKSKLKGGSSDIVIIDAIIL